MISFEKFVEEWKEYLIGFLYTILSSKPIIKLIKKMYFAFV